MWGLTIYTRDCKDCKVTIKTSAASKVRCAPCQKIHLLRITTLKHREYRKAKKENVK